MAPQPVRIVLIEDHAILREGLRALIELEPDLRVVGEATCASEGLAAVKAAEPALVITDLALPGTSGLRTIQELRALSPQLRVLVLTAHCTDEYIRAALNAGADGYVLKDASRAELMQGIRAAINGQKYFSEPVSARLVSGLRLFADERLRERGYEVFAVNPAADQVEGDTCYPDLTSIPGGVDWVVIGTRPQTAEATIRECADLITRPR